MALNAAFAFEVRLTGDDANGGGFRVGAAGADRSQSDTPWATLSVASVVHSTTTQVNVNAADYTVSSADIGNAFQIAGGTATAGVYEITAVDVANNRWTLDRSVGTAGQTCPGRMGGAFASPGKAAGVATVAGMTVFIKYNASPYVATTSTANVPGGVVSGTAGTAYVGYDTTRAMWVWPVQANRPTFQLGAGVTGVPLFGNLNANYHVQHIIPDANSQTGSRCTQMSGILYYVKGMNGVAGGLIQNSNGIAILCEVTGCVAIPINFFTCLWCVAHDNSLTVTLNQGAFASSGSGSLCYACISYNNGCDGFSASCYLVNCVAYGNTGMGFNTVNFTGAVYVNCIAEANQAYGYRLNAGTLSLINCADYNNTSGRVQIAGGKFWGDILPISGTSSFFVNAASPDFRLNSDAGGGALLRGAAFPASFPVPANSNFLDVGALQHLDAGGASGPIGRFISAQRGTPY